MAQGGRNSVSMVDVAREGSWWLSVFPGLMLLSIVLLFDTIGNNLSKLIQAKSAQL